MGDLVATQGRPYRIAGPQVQASPCLPPCLLRTVASPGPPPWAQHGAVFAPCAQRWPQTEGVILGPRPFCAPLTPEEDCGLGLPARFFLEIEGVFISSRFFLENMVERFPAALGVDSRPGGSQPYGSWCWLSLDHIAQGHPLPSCQTHVMGLALIGGQVPNTGKGPQQREGEVTL